MPELGTTPSSRQGSGRVQGLSLSPRIRVLALRQQQQKQLQQEQQQQQPERSLLLHRYGLRRTHLALVALTALVVAITLIASQHATDSQEAASHAEAKAAAAEARATAESRQRRVSLSETFFTRAFGRRRNGGPSKHLPPWEKGRSGGPRANGDWARRRSVYEEGLGGVAGRRGEGEEGSGRGVYSPYVWPRRQVNEGTRECRSIRPLRGHPVIQGQNRTGAEVARARRASGRNTMRVVIWSPRKGLGNSLRGLVLTTVYALLASRQLLVSDEGVYHNSIRTLYLGFDAGILDWAEDLPGSPAHLDVRHPDFSDPRPIVRSSPSHFVDKMWTRRRRVRSCVFSALGCKQVWCVHSRALQLAVGAPKPILGQAVERILRVAPALSWRERRLMLRRIAQAAQAPHAPTWKQSLSLVSGRKGHQDSGSKGRGRDSMDSDRKSDRHSGRSSASDSRSSGRSSEAGDPDDESEDPGSEGGDTESESGDTDSIASKGEAERDGAKRRILGWGGKPQDSESGGADSESAGTDTESGDTNRARAGARRRLLGWGSQPGDSEPVDGKLKSSKPKHSKFKDSEGGDRDSESGNSTPAVIERGNSKAGDTDSEPGDTNGVRAGARRRLLGWGSKDRGGIGEGRLQGYDGGILNVRFDVALHVRTMHECVEEGHGGGLGAGKCRAGGVKRSLEALKESPGLLRFVTTEQWHCVARALALLLQLKRQNSQAQSEIKGGAQGVRGAQAHAGEGRRGLGAWGSGGSERDSDSASLYSTVPGLFEAREDRTALKCFVRDPLYLPGLKGHVAPSEQFPEDVWSAEDSLAFAELAGAPLPACNRTNRGEFLWNEEEGRAGQQSQGGDNGHTGSGGFGFLPMFLASKFKSRQEEASLSIFLATDSELLRPLFVEYLRPFGRVWYANASVVHLARGAPAAGDFPSTTATNTTASNTTTASDSTRASDAETADTDPVAEAASVRARLDTLGEFYLISRAAVLLTFTEYRSSFSEVAALYGNTTALSVSNTTNCTFISQHVAERARF